MTDAPPNVTLIAGGLSFAGWKGVSISAGLDEACRGFELGVLDVNLPTDQPPGNPILVRPGTEIEVWNRDQLVLTGFLDRISISTAGESSNISMAGRSKTADLVDCTAFPSRRRWTERDVLTIAQQIAQGYSVEVVWGLNEPIPKVGKFRLQRAEKCLQAIDRLVKPLGLLLTDNPDGQLVITRVGATKASTALESGQNILASDGTYDASMLFASYFCRGQIALATDDPANLLAHVEGGTQEDIAARERSLEIIPSGRTPPGRCQTLAEYEAQTRSGRSVSVRYTVNGWTQGDGTLWEPGQLVQVTDTTQAIVAELLIAAVDYTLDETAGEQAVLHVYPRAAYELLPEPERKKRKRRRKGPHDGIGVWIPQVGQLQIGIGGVIATGALQIMSSGKQPQNVKKIPKKRPDKKEWWGLTNPKKKGG